MKKKTPTEIRTPKQDEKGCYGCGLAFLFKDLREVFCGHLLCEACDPGAGCVCPSCEEAEHER